MKSHASFRNGPVGSPKLLTHRVRFRRLSLFSQLPVDIHHAPIFSSKERMVVPPLRYWTWPSEEHTEERSARLRLWGSCNIEILRPMCGGAIPLYQGDVRKLVVRIRIKATAKLKVELACRPMRTFHTHADHSEQRGLSELSHVRHS